MSVTVFVLSTQIVVAKRRTGLQLREYFSLAEEVVDVDREQGWTEHRALRYTACDLHFSGCVRTKNHTQKTKNSVIKDKRFIPRKNI